MIFCGAEKRAPSELGLNSLCPPPGLLLICLEVHYFDRMGGTTAGRNPKESEDDHPAGGGSDRGDVPGVYRRRGGGAQGRLQLGSQVGIVT